MWFYPSIPKMRAAGNSVVLIFLVLSELVTMVARSTPVAEQFSTHRPPIQCQPLPHDILWKRINPRLVEDDSVSRYRRSISSGSQLPRGKLNLESRGEGHDRDVPSTNLTAKPKKGGRSFRKKGLHVALLGQSPGLLSADVYQPVGKRGDNQDRAADDGTASPRRKRKLTGRNGKKGKPTPPNNLRTPTGSPWHCRLEKKWKKMRDGIFPQQIQTGRCVAKTCMMTMYECRPKKYAIRVLKRLDGRCNPLPVTGFNTTYEEVWVMDYYKVTVACECSRMKPSGTYGTT